MQKLSTLINSCGPWERGPHLNAFKLKYSKDPVHIWNMRNLFPSDSRRSFLIEEAGCRSQRSAPVSELFQLCVNSCNTENSGWNATGCHVQVFRQGNHRSPHGP